MQWWKRAGAPQAEPAYAAWIAWLERGRLAQSEKPESSQERDYCEACGYTDSHDPNCPRPRAEDSPTDKGERRYTEAEMRLVQEELLREQREAEHLQAKIDRLMLEHCPQDMTPEQLEEWRTHQVPAGPEAEAALASAVSASRDTLPPEKLTPAWHGLSVDWDHMPADVDEAIEMLRRAKRDLVNAKPGWISVPTEPTPAMLDAGDAAAYAASTHRPAMRIWEAMLLAVTHT
jgi:hypothetical protein